MALIMLCGSRSHTLELKCWKGHVLTVACIWPGVVRAHIVVLSNQPWDTTLQAMGGGGRSFSVQPSCWNQFREGERGNCFLCDSNLQFDVLSATHPVSSPLILLWYCDRLLKVVFRFNELNVAAFVTASRIQIFIVHACACIMSVCESPALFWSYGLLNLKFIDLSPFLKMPHNSIHLCVCM